MLTLNHTILLNSQYYKFFVDSHSYAVCVRNSFAFSSLISMSFFNFISPILFPVLEGKCSVCSR